MEQTLNNANIFFLITSVVTVLLGILFVILLYYIIKITRHLEHTAKKIKEESGRIIDDVSMFRETIEEQGGRLASFLNFAFGALFSSKKKGGAKAKKTSSKKGLSKEE